jgi:hypothetical protein
MLEKLWNDIKLIYENSFKNVDGYVDDIIILSQDNYYLVHYIDGKNTIGIRIEKDYNLVRMWGGDVPYDITNYKLVVEVNNKLEVDENYKMKLAYKIITPFLREVKLNKIGV